MSLKSEQVLIDDILLCMVEDLDTTSRNRYGIVLHATPLFYGKYFKVGAIWAPNVGAAFDQYSFYGTEFQGEMEYRFSYKTRFRLIEKK